MAGVGPALEFCESDRGASVGAPTLVTVGAPTLATMGAPTLATVGAPTLAASGRRCDSTVSSRRSSAARAVRDRGRTHACDRWRTHGRDRGRTHACDRWRTNASRADRAREDKLSTNARPEGQTRSQRGSNERITEILRRRLDAARILSGDVYQQRISSGSDGKRMQLPLRTSWLVLDDRLAASASRQSVRCAGNEGRGAGSEESC